MNIRFQGIGRMYMGNNRISGMMKSTEQKLERQEKRDSQVAFFESRKDSLKNIQCGSAEEAARVLEMFHTYEDQIAAVKQEYNREQLMHSLDEAKERGEQLAKAIEKSEYKTPEERKKEMAEEAMGIDEEKGALSESLEEITGKLEELMTEEVSEMTEDIAKVQEEMKMDAPAQEAEKVLLQDMDPENPVPYKRLDVFA